MSSFLTHKSVKSLLEMNGPSITHSVVQSIARILNRFSPSVSEIFASSQGVHQEDNLWSLDGQEPFDEQAKWNQSNRDEKENTKYPGFERPQIKSVLGKQLDGAISPKVVVSNTTMQNLASFSVSSASYNSTFATAGSHLSELRAHNLSSVTSNQRSRERSQHNNKELQIERSLSTTSAKARTVGLHKAAAVQGNLLNFFKRGDSLKSEAFGSSTSPKVRPVCDGETSRSKKPRFDIVDPKLPEPTLPLLERRSTQRVQPSLPSLEQHRLRVGPLRAKPHASKSEDSLS